MAVDSRDCIRGCGVNGSDRFYKEAWEKEKEKASEVVTLFHHILFAFSK